MFRRGQGRCLFRHVVFVSPAVLVSPPCWRRCPKAPALSAKCAVPSTSFFLPDPMDLLQSALETNHFYSTKLLLSATSLSIFAGLGLMLSLMVGFARAYELPSGEWSYGSVWRAHSCW